MAIQIKELVNKILDVVNESPYGYLNYDSKEEPKSIFQEAYKYEEVWNVKDISEHNLENL